MLIFSVAATSMAAYEYFVYGKGAAMNIDPILPYAISMVVLCFGLSFYNTKQNKRIHNTSTILTAEAKSNFVDGLQSLGIGVAVILLYLIDEQGQLGFLHYTGDFFVTVILALASLKQPVKVLNRSFIELSNGTTKDVEIRRIVTGTIDTHLSGVIPNRRCDIFKTGMHIKIRIIVPDSVSGDMLLRLEEARQKVLNDLSATYDSIELFYSF
jgi:predicted Co/Zn/Cd cation transporter (cation efflux family)